MKRKKVLVTGAGKGIGRGIALAFAKAGADLFLHYRSDPAEARSLQDEIAALGGKATVFQADLADQKELDAMFGAIRQQWGTLDAAVNNAGWDPGAVALDDIDEKMYYRLTDMNIKGTLFCCLRELELMGRGGSIINLGSVQMNTTVPGRVLYAASKGAIHAMTGALALEAGPRGIRVNTIAPGYIAVERMTRWRREFRCAGSASRKTSAIWRYFWPRIRPDSSPARPSSSTAESTASSHVFPPDPQFFPNCAAPGIS